MKGFKGFLVAEGVERTILADGQRLLIPSVSIDKLVDEPSVLREGVREALPRPRDQRAVPQRTEERHGRQAPVQRKHGDHRTGAGAGHSRHKLLLKKFSAAIRCLRIYSLEKVRQISSISIPS